MATCKTNSKLTVVLMIALGFLVAACAFAAPKQAYAYDDRTNELTGEFRITYDDKYVVCSPYLTAEEFNARLQDSVRAGFQTNRNDFAIDFNPMYCYICEFIGTDTSQTNVIPNYRAATGALELNKLYYLRLNIDTPDPNYWAQDAWAGANSSKAKLFINDKRIYSYYISSWASDVSWATQDTYLDIFVPIRCQDLLTSITISPRSMAVQKGSSSADLSATVLGPSIMQGVSWYITSLVSSTGTWIADTGRLYVGADETATSITVRAASSYPDYNSSVYDEITVAVTEIPPTYGTPQFVDPVATVRRGASQAYTVTLVGGNQPLSFDWTMTPQVPITNPESRTSLVRYNGQNNMALLTVDVNEPSQWIEITGTHVGDSSVTVTYRVQIADPQVISGRIDLNITNIPQLSYATNSLDTSYSYRDEMIASGTGSDAWYIDQANTGISVYNPARPTNSYGAYALQQEMYTYPVAIGPDYYWLITLHTRPGYAFPDNLNNLTVYYNGQRVSAAYIDVDSDYSDWFYVMVPARSLGDVNGDYKVNIVDAVCTFDLANGRYSAAQVSAALPYADVAGGVADGAITANDAYTILYAVAHG